MALAQEQRHREVEQKQIHTYTDSIHNRGSAADQQERIDFPIKF